jgi:hypothetical protein
LKRGDDRLLYLLMGRTPLPPTYRTVRLETTLPGWPYPSPFCSLNLRTQVTESGVF